MNTWRAEVEGRNVSWGTIENRGVSEAFWVVGIGNSKEAKGEMIPDAANIKDLFSSGVDAMK